MIIWNENKKVKKKIIMHIDKRAGLFPYKKDPAHGRVQSSIINKNYNSKMDGIWAGEGGRAAGENRSGPLFPQGGGGRLSDSCVVCPLEKRLTAGGKNRLSPGACFPGRRLYHPGVSLSQ